MARQMGFSQVIPAPYSTDPAQQICHFVPHSFKEIKAFISENLLTRTFYDPIPCRSSNFVTRNFIKWWDAYYRQYNRSLDEMIAGINRKKEQLKENEKESNPSEVPSKTTLASEKPRTPESARSVSGHSLDVSSKSKESSNSKDKRVSPEKERIEESIARESAPSLDIIVGEERSPCGLSSEGYSISNLSKSAERSNLAIEEINQALNNPIENMNSPLKEREIIQEEVSSNPKVPIQTGSNQGIYIDPRIQFKDKNEEKALREKEALYEKHLSNANDTLEGLSKTREDLVKKLAEIQAQIQEVDEKMTKLKKPFEKIQDKKTKLGNQLSEIEKSKLQNEADLKRLQEEELQELDLFKGFEDNKIQLKDTLEEFLQELGD
ncbi:hypothetical protein PIB30_063355 [Stylosanthes scabra]|uniref:Uncharacterized protein n=1 Tax=Stylosanthes scabra TaxID=79078 RepID=A0ABU6QLZ4_9FABA|nr:hypothetical protein [Stylosanthes scabra]